MVIEKDLDGTLKVTLHNGIVFWATDYVDLEEGLGEIALAIQLNKFRNILRK